MGKRANEDSQLSRSEYEARENLDSGSDNLDGRFQRASNDTIAKRRILKARVGPKKSTETTTPSPFSGFQALTGDQNGSSDKPSKNPFAGFAGLTGPSTSSAVPTQASSGNATSKAPSTYQEAIEELNSSFFEFVKEQSKANPCGDWVSAMQEYITYADDIEKQFESSKPVPYVPNALTNDNGPKSGPSAGFSLGKGSTDTDKSPGKPLFAKSTPASTEKTIPAFSFGATASTATASPAKVGGFSFGQTASKTDSSSPSTSAPTTATTASSSVGFSFGTPASKSSTETSASSSGFSFGASVSKPAGFSFGAPTSSSGSSSFSFGAKAAPTAAASSATAEDEDEENIGREEATVILKSDNSDDDTAFEVEKAKIFEFKRDDKRWADKGVHPLKVLVHKETKNARILMRNQIGKVVLNASLYKGLKIQTHETKGKKTGLILLLQAEGGMTKFMLKVNPDQLPAFQRALEQHTPQ